MVKTEDALLATKATLLTAKPSAKSKTNTVRSTTKTELHASPASKDTGLTLKVDASMVMSTVLSSMRLASASIAIGFTSSTILVSASLGILSVRYTPMDCVHFVGPTLSRRKGFVCPIWLGVENSFHMEIVSLVRMAINSREEIVWPGSLN